MNAAYSQREPMITFPADVLHATMVNGVRLDNQSIAVAQGNVDYKLNERAPSWYFSLKLNRLMPERDWTWSTDRYDIFQADPAALAQLQATAGDLFRVASAAPERLDVPDIARSMQELLLVALDRTFAARNDYFGMHWPRQYLRLIDRLDAALYASSAGVFYSGDLAREFNVSIRTLHNAVTRIRGMSLHQYLRFRRLWKIRSELLLGRPGMQVKTCALANGFWHMGEFALAYRRCFGEPPSTTLARARED